MLSKRVIPCLDVRNGRLTKGVKFAGNQDIGDPVESARRYYEEGAASPPWRTCAPGSWPGRKKSRSTPRR